MPPICDNYTDGLRSRSNSVLLLSMLMTHENSVIRILRYKGFYTFGEIDSQGNSHRIILRFGYLDG